MIFLKQTLLLIPIIYFIVGRDYRELWKGGLIGVGIMVFFDTIGYFMNLYVYNKEFVMVLGILPLFQIVNVFLISLAYLKCLPNQWSSRMLYTVYVSVILLGMEAFTYSKGALLYPNWKIGYSYLLIILGLSLLAYLWDVSQRAAVKTS